LWGYQVSEVELSLPPIDPDVECHVYNCTKRTKPILCSSEAGDATVSAPRPDTHSTLNGLAAVYGRMYKKTPDIDPKELEELRSFMDKYILTFPRLRDEDIQSTEEWVETRKRPGNWKRKLLRELDRVNGDVSKFTKEELCEIKMHIKDESYPEFKYPRGIFARQDPNKLLFGPLVTAMEKRIYDDPFFIKYIPVKDRADHIITLLDEYQYIVCSDFSSFEGSFKRSFMNEVERRIFKHMIADLSPNLRFMYNEAINAMYDSPRHVTTGLGFFLRFVGKRLSGEMWTSLMNGVSNKVLWTYFTSKRGGTLIGCVEGDDGIFGYNSIEHIPTTADFRKLGFDCKIEHYSDCRNASFCGIVFDSVSKTNICDPRQFLADIAWLPYRYAGFRSSKKRSLVRARALSYKHQYPGCPIIEHACRALMRLTSGHDMRWVFEKSGFFNAYEEELFVSALDDKDIRTYVDVADSTRYLMYEKYGIQISVQLELEHFFNSLGSLSFEYPQHLKSLIFDESWCSYVDHFTANADGLSADDIVFMNTPIEKYLKHWSANSNFISLVLIEG